MKRLLILMLVFMYAAILFAQQAPTPAAPAQQQQQSASTPAAKPLPQAKTQEEYKAFQDAAAVIQKGDPTQGEAATDAFVAKFKSSEISPILYHMVLRLYQTGNNADKAIEVGKKILAINPNDPVANILVASMISERVRDTDLDRDERLADAEKDAKRGLQTIDTDLQVNPGISQEQIESSKSMLRSMAYAALANIEATRSNFPQAENYFKQAITVPGAQMDAVTFLRYSLLLDKEKKYPEALAIANKAVETSTAGSPEQDLAKRERDRLNMLVSGNSPATPAKQ